MSRPATRGRTPRLTPRNGRLARRDPLTLARVLAAAREILEETEYESLSLREVAKRVGVTPPALYMHVDDKLDLLRRVAKQGFEELTRLLDPLPPIQPAEQIHFVAATILQYAQENRGTWSVMMLESAAAHDRQHGSMPIAAEPYLIAHRALEGAIDCGAISGEDRILTTMTLWGVVHGLVMAMISGGNDGETDRRVMRNAIDALLRGMAPQPLPSEGTAPSLADRRRPVLTER